MPDTDPIGSGYKAGTHMVDLDGTAPSAGDLDSPQGYVSDAELMAWLQAKSGTQYDELRKQMNISTGRQDLIKSLNGIKDAIAHASTTEKIEEVRQTMQDLLDHYADTPYATELTSLFGGTLNELNYPHDGSVIEQADEFTHDFGVLGLLTEPITSETDHLGKIDSLALIQIQEIASDAKETSQLASNLLSSRDQTRGGIIGNIRA
jgi:hypothetical protein